MKTYINLDIKQYTENLGGQDDNDSWSRDSTNTVNEIGTEFTVSNKQGYNDIAVDFPIEPNKDYYLLYVEYGTGDSFGSDGGQLELIDVYEDLGVATEQLNKIELDYKIYQKNTYKADYNVTLTLGNGKEVKLSCPWKGYFESLEYVQIQTIRLKQ